MIPSPFFIRGIRNAKGEIHRGLRRFFHATILALPMAKRNDPPKTPNNANKNAWLLTSVSEPFAFLASFGGFSSVAPERRWVIGG
jgi:hypothetical protein